MTWRFHFKLLLAFAAWNLIAIAALPLYAELVVPTAQALLNLIEPHGARFAFEGVFPTVTWRVTHETKHLEHLLAFRLLAYNLVLYLTALTVVPRVSNRQRGGFLISGLPFLFGFHVFDLTMWAESRLLTEIRPQAYDIWEQFDLWFAFVKFYSHFSVLALKQVVPLFLVWLQWSLQQQLTESGNIDSRR